MGSLIKKKKQILISYTFAKDFFFVASPSDAIKYLFYFILQSLLFKSFVCLPLDFLKVLYF